MCTDTFTSICKLTKDIKCAKTLKLTQHFICRISHQANTTLLVFRDIHSNTHYSDVALEIWLNAHIML